MIETLLKATLRLEYLNSVTATEENKSVIWERKELQRTIKKLMPEANIQFQFYQVSHPPRF